VEGDEIGGDFRGSSIMLNYKRPNFYWLPKDFTKYNYIEP